jgi:hypothetical protein
LKVLPILLAIMLLPAFVWWSNLHYQQNLHPLLTQAAREALAAPEFSQVRVSIDYLDAHLDGKVATPLLRFDAERLVDQVPGLTVLRGDNRLIVPAQLSISRQQGQLAAAGLLPRGSEDGLGQLLADPGQVITDEVAYHAHASSPIELDNPLLGALVTSFFAVAGDRGFRFDGTRVQLWGDATRAMGDEWSTAIGAIFPGLEFESNLNLYPSRYQLPDYRPVAKLPPDLYLSLSRSLQESPICFADEGVELAQEEGKRLAKLAERLSEASPALPLAIGGYSGASGDAETALERAEKVKAALIKAGMESEQLEIHPFDADASLPTPQRNRDNCVEIVII